MNEIPEVNMELIETTVPELISKYKGNKRFNYDYEVNLVDQATKPLTLKFNVRGHTIILQFENSEIKSKQDLSDALVKGDVDVSCNCADATYRFNYWSSVNGYGLSHEHRRPEKTNNKNDIGPYCKHVACVLKQRDKWIDKVKGLD